MRRIMTVCTALVAVLSLSAVVAASALAAPEFKPSTEQGFTSSGTTATLRAPGTTITCSASTSKGKITGAKAVGSVFVVFTGCKAKVSSECSVKSPGAKEGEVATVELDGALGAVAEKEAATKVGMDLKPASGSSFVTTEGSCLLGGKSEVTGSVIGEVSPVGGPASTAGKLIYEAGGTTKQEIQKFKGEETDTLKAFGFFEVSEETTESITFEKAVEVT